MSLAVPAVLLAVAGALRLSRFADDRRRLFVGGANVLALTVVVAELLASHGAHAQVLACVVMLAVVAGTMLAMPARVFSRDAAMALLFGEAACSIAAFTESPAMLAVAAALGLAAAVLNAGLRSAVRAARVHLVLQVAAHLLMIGGFAAFAYEAEGVGRVCVLAGICLAAGVAPLQAGVLDLFELGAPGQVLAFVAAPLPWFLVAAAPERLVPHGASDLAAPVLLLSALAAGLAGVTARSRWQFLCRARTSLLSLALFAVVLAPGGAPALLSCVAYLSAVVGLTLVEAIAEARVGSGLAEAGGLAHALQGLAGFALFFALAAANLPLTANFAAAEVLGAASAALGPIGLIGTVVAFALLGFASYRRYAHTFLGPAAVSLPELALRPGERAGLVWLAATSLAGAALALLA